MRPRRKEKRTKVYVIGMNGMGLAPTTPGKARRLLKNKRAVVIYGQPFTIQLLYKTGCAHPKMTFGVDTGSQYIGLSVIDKTRQVVIDKAEVALRSTMEKRKLTEKRKDYRRGRRYRKTRTGQLQAFKEVFLFKVLSISVDISRKTLHLGYK